MDRDEWLRLPWLVRAWRVLTCRHRGGGRQIGKLIDEDRRDRGLDPNDFIDESFEYALIVRRCSRCRRNYIADEGLQTRGGYLWANPASGK